MIKLSLTKGYVTLLSDEDADLAELAWYAAEMATGVYAHRTTGTTGKNRVHYVLSRIILERMGIPMPKGVYADHINGDTLDNRRENLRAVTNRENARNIGGKRSHHQEGSHLGVCFDKSRGKWMAHISKDKKFKNLGRFDTEAEALAARLKAEKEEWGIQPRRVEAHTG